MLIIVFLSAAFDLASSEPAMPSTTDFDVATPGVTVFGRELPTHRQPHRPGHHLELPCNHFCLCLGRGPSKCPSTKEFRMEDISGESPCHGIRDFVT